MNETHPDEPGHDEPKRSETDDTVPDHLSELADGCGCAEVWEHLSADRDTD